jgi:hypothetical protein
MRWIRTFVTKIEPRHVGLGVTLPSVQIDALPLPPTERAELVSGITSRRVMRHKIN